MEQIPLTPEQKQDISMVFWKFHESMNELARKHQAGSESDFYEVCIENYAFCFFNNYRDRAVAHCIQVADKILHCEENLKKVMKEREL